MIQVKNITKRYGSCTALNNISFEVKKGEILGFLGPNGAGKTTLMRILTGYFPPTDGQAFVNGQDIETATIALKKTIGYLPEQVPLYYDMPVTAFLSYVARIKGVAHAAVHDHCNDIIAQCGLTDVRRRLIRNLSKGYKQRVGLAQALIGDPELLILDEPTTGLDPKQIIEIRSLIKNMAGNKTVILSTHILPEVSVICDRVIIINEGTIVAIDTPQNLERHLSSGMDIEVTVRGNCEAVQKRLDSIEGVASSRLRSGSAEITDRVEETSLFVVKAREDADIRPQIARALAQDFELLEMRLVHLSLEDIFVKLVTREENHA